MLANTKKYKLPNGLKVVYQKNPSAAVSALQVWVGIGSRDELRGENAKFQDEGGLAHIQEHMLFQGTYSFPKQGQIASLVEANGGDFNAWTNYDETVYHITMPSQNTKLGLDILASMVSEMTCEPDRLEKELEVVMEEFRRCNDNPHNILQEELFKVAYRVHPYHHPIIGYEETIKGIDQATVLNFFHKYYCPENMTLVLVSNLDESEADEFITASFGQIPAKTCPKNEIPVEPNQNETRVLIMKKDFEGTYISLGHHITAFEDSDTPALDLLYTILGHGDDSRLNRELVEKQKLAHSISAGAYTPKNPGFGFIDAELDSNKLKLALKSIFLEIAKISQNQISLTELKKAKNLLESQFIYSQESFQGIAKTLGQFELIGGGYENIPKYLENLRSISVDDIQRVAKKYLKKENCTIGILLSEKEDFEINKTEILELIEDVQSTSDQKTEEELGVVSIREDKLTSISNSQACSEAKKHTLQNGIRVILQENHAVGSASFHMTMLGGLLSETSQNNGINNLISRLLTRGTNNLSQEAIASQIESMASQIDGFSSQNSLGLSGKCLSQNLIASLEIALDCLTNAQFTEDEINKQRIIILDEINRELDNPIQKVFDLFNASLYQKHPYGLKTLGEKKAIESFDQKILQDKYKSLVNPSQIVISIVGQLNSEEILQFLEKKFNTFEGSKQTIEFKTALVPEQNTKQSIKTSKQQSNIVLGFPGLEMNSPDIFILEILRKALAGMGGRLFINLRDRQGLAYSITALQKPGLNCPGHFATYLGCAPEKESYAIEEIRRELKEIKQSGISETELKDAKNFLIGSHSVYKQSNSAKSSILYSNELYGLGFDYDERFEQKINQVNSKDVLRVANDIIDLNRETLAIVGPN